MTKAQEVRNRRLEKMKIDIFEQAQQVFDWILDLIDTDTNTRCFRSIELCLFDDQNQFKTTDLNGTDYDLSDILLRHDRIAFLTTLKNVIEQEEGYKANFESAELWDSKCIVFQVVVA